MSHVNRINKNLRAAWPLACLGTAAREPRPAEGRTAEEDDEATAVDDEAAAFNEDACEGPGVADTANGS